MVRTDSAHLRLVKVPKPAMRFEFTRRLPIRIDTFVDRTGHTYGKLTVIGLAGYDGVLAVWLCRCECGLLTIVRVNRLRKYKPQQTCGHCSRISSDGLRQKHPLYFTWRGMIGRCFDRTDNSWPWYGARGITVCDRWKSFRNFIEDMGEKPSKRHTIERVDNDGNYEPTNCVWATPDLQRRNQRPRGRHGKDAVNAINR